MRLAERIWLLVVEVGYADGGTDHYLVLAVEDGAGWREPRDGEGAWTTLLRDMATSSELSGAIGRVVLDPSPALDELVPSAAQAAAALDERRLGVEQTNTSVVLGERLILKLYRLLEPGVNPEVEVSAFLTDVGFGHTPPLVGSGRYLSATAEPASIVICQALVAADGDAWRAVVDWLAEPGGEAHATAAAATIGGITRELHAALASRPDAAGFPARPATDDELVAWRAAAERQLAGALDVAPERIGPLAGAIRSRLDALTAARGTPVSRIHGDYHLGQLLHGTDGRFWVIDFEGEPARPLDERRALASPLRDVAGMLRSFDYAARTAERADPPAGFDASRWLDEARAAFLDGYGMADDAAADLLAAFEIEKACYEVRYEAAMRPDWTWLPLDALARMLNAETRP